MIGLGQGWTNTYQFIDEWGNNTFSYGSSVLQDDATGNYIWLVNASGAESQIKVINTEGEVLSTNVLIGWGGVVDLQKTSDGGYLARAGTRIVKLNSSFNVEWGSEPIPLQNEVFQWGYPFVNDVKEASDGGYILTGSLPWWDPNTGTIHTYNMYIRKLNANGSEEWLTSTFGAGHTQGASVLEYNDGYIVIVDNAEDKWATTASNSLLSKYSLNGDLLSSIPLVDANNNPDPSGKIIPTADGNYIVYGSKKNLNSESSVESDKDIWIKKIDFNGEFIWEKFYGHGFLDYTSSVRETTDGGYIISGAADLPWEFMGLFESCCMRKIWVLKTDFSGDTLWTKEWSNNNQDDQDYGYDVIEANDGDYVVTGTILDLNIMTNQAIIVKFSPPFITSINESMTEYNKTLRSITNLLGQEIPIRKNTPMFYIYDDGSVEKKIIIE